MEVYNTEKMIEGVTETPAEKIRNEMLRKYQQLRNLKFDDTVLNYDFFTDDKRKTEGPSYPVPIGFKIHIPILDTDPEYLDTLQAILDTCDEITDGGRPTALKIAIPRRTQDIYALTGKQKGVVIYPCKSEKSQGYLKSNLSETLRIDKILGPILMKINGYQDINIKQDIRLPSGLWVRFGRLGQPQAYYLDGSYEDSSEPFWDRFVKLDADPSSLFSIITGMEEARVIVPAEVKENIRHRMLTDSVNTLEKYRHRGY